MRKRRRYTVWSGFDLLATILVLAVRSFRWLFQARSSRRLVTESGYVKLTQTNQYEHRVVAERWLGRRLEPEEVVHHINGNPADNRALNLCVLGQGAHDDFHSWLRWKKDKDGRYPNFEYQRTVLRRLHGGILLG